MKTRLDLNNTSSWSPYKKDHCKACQALCCTQEVDVDIQDLLQMELITLDQKDILSEEEIYKFLKLKNIVSRYNKKSKKFSMALNSSNQCQYLDLNKKCSIYSKRPKVCRDYPYPSSKPGFCPYIPKFN